MILALGAALACDIPVTTLSIDGDGLACLDVDVGVNADLLGGVVSFDTNRCGGPVQVVSIGGCEGCSDVITLGAGDQGELFYDGPVQSTWVVQLWMLHRGELAHHEVRYRVGDPFVRCGLLPGGCATARSGMPRWWRR